MADRERVVQVIGETITAEVESTAFNEIIGGERRAVNVEKVAQTAADRLECEGLLR